MTIPGADASRADVLSWLHAEYDQPFVGWDFSVFRGRIENAPVPWDFGRTLAEQPYRQAAAVLDIDTGDGGFLSQVIGWHGVRPLMVATEGHEPNVPLAATRLGANGVNVVAAHGERLPFASANFDLVLNRHGLLPVVDIHRVLRPGGKLLTQQVGDRANVQIFDWLGASVRRDAWNLDGLRQQVIEAGFHVEYGAEAFQLSRFRDVGTLVYYLKAVPWHVCQRP